jgi:hypothetical protein
MECSVANDLPFKMLDDPSPLATLAELEQHLADLQAMPDFVLKEKYIQYAKKLIAQEKRLKALEKAQTGGLE